MLVNELSSLGLNIEFLEKKSLEEESDREEIETVTEDMNGEDENV